MTNWDSARSLVADWEARGYIEAPQEDAGRLQVRAAIDKFLRYLEINRKTKPQTIKLYRDTLVHAEQPKHGYTKMLALETFCTRKGINFIADVTLDDLEELQRAWDGYSVLTIYNYTTRLKSLWTYLHRRNLIPTDEAMDLPLPDTTEVERTQPYTPEQMISMLAAADEADIYAFILLLRYSGLRISDAIMRPVNNLSGETMILRQIKPGTFVTVSLPPLAIDALQSCPRMSEDYWFWDGKRTMKQMHQFWYKRLKKLFKKADVEDGHPHRFRDTFAVELLLSGADVKKVSDLLGHSSVLTTEKHYLQWVKRRQQRADEQIRRAWEIDPILNHTPQLRDKSETVKLPN